MFDDDTLADFLADGEEETIRPRKSGNSRRQRESSGSDEWEDSNEEFSEGSAVSESDDVLDDNPRSDSSSDGDDDDSDAGGDDDGPPVAVLSSTENEESGEEDGSDDDAQSVSSTEEFIAKRVKKSLKKLPKRVTASTWWNTNKGPLSTSVKKRRKIRRASNDRSDSNDDSPSSSPAVQRQRRRMTISDDEEDDEEDDDEDIPSCSKVKKNGSRSDKKKSTAVSDEESASEQSDEDSPVSRKKRRHRTGDDDSKVKRTPIVEEGGEEEEEEEDSTSNSQVKTGAKTKTSRTPVEDEEDASESKGEEDMSPVVTRRRTRSAPHATSKRPKTVSSSEESDSSDRGVRSKVKSGRKKIRTSSSPSSEEESDNEPTTSSRGTRSSTTSSNEVSNIRLRSNNRRRSNSYGLNEDDDDDDDLSAHRKTYQRVAKRHRSYFFDEDDDDEDDLPTMTHDDSEINTTDDLGNNAQSKQDTSGSSNDSTRMSAEGSKHDRCNDVRYVLTRKVPSPQATSENEKDPVLQAADELGITLEPSEQGIGADRTRDEPGCSTSGGASGNNPESRMEQNLGPDNESVERTEQEEAGGDKALGSKDEGVVETMQLGSDSTVTGNSAGDKNKDSAAECDIAQGSHSPVEMDKDHVTTNQPESDGSKDLTSTNSLLEKVLDGLEEDGDDENMMNRTIAERDDIFRDALETVLNDTDSNTESAMNGTGSSPAAPNDIDEDAAVERALKILNEDTVQENTNKDTAPKDTNEQTSANNNSKPVDDDKPPEQDYDSDDSIVECAVPPKTPPIEITLSSDDDDDLVPPPPVTTAPVIQPNAFHVNSRPGSGGGFSYSGNMYMQQQQQQPSGGFVFGAPSVQTNRGEATQRYGNRTGNLPQNYQSLNQSNPFQQQSYQQQVARGWHQTNNNVQQTGNRLPIGSNEQYHQSFSNAHHQATKASSSVGHATVHRSSDSGAQGLVRNKSGGTPQALNTAQHRQLHNSVMSRLDAVSNNDPHSLVENHAQLRTMLKSESINPRSLAGSHALIRNLLNNDTSMSSHMMMRGNAITAERFPSPDHLQTSQSLSEIVTQRREEYLQAARNYIQPGTISNTDAVPSMTRSSYHVTNPFASIPTSQQSAQNVSDRNGAMARNYIQPGTMSSQRMVHHPRLPADESNQRIVYAATSTSTATESNQRVVHATSTARISVPVGSISHQSRPNPFGVSAKTHNPQQLSRVSSVHNAQSGVHERAASSSNPHRTQLVGNTNNNAATQYQQILSSVSHAPPSRPTGGVVAHGPITQAVNSFQMRGNTLKQHISHPLGVPSGAASGATRTNVHNSHPLGIPSGTTSSGSTRTNIHSVSNSYPLGTPSVATTGGGAARTNSHHSQQHSSSIVTGAHPQMLHRVNTSVSGRVSNAQQIVNQYQMPARQHVPSVNPTPERLVSLSHGTRQHVPSVNPAPERLVSLSHGTSQSATHYPTLSSTLQHGGLRQNTSAPVTGHPSRTDHGLFAQHRNQVTPDAPSTSSRHASIASMSNAQQPVESVEMPQRLRNAHQLLNSVAQCSSSFATLKQNAPATTQWNQYPSHRSNESRPIVAQSGSQRLNASSVDGPSAIQITQVASGTRIFNVRDHSALVNTSSRSQNHAPDVHSSVRDNRDHAFSSMQRLTSSQPMLAHQQRHVASTSNVNPMQQHSRHGMPGSSQSVPSTFLNRPNRKKPVVILRDILSQVKSVNFGGTGEQEAENRRRLRIGPGKKFLIKENGNNGSQDIIPLQSPVRAISAPSFSARLQNGVSSEHDDSVTNGVYTQL